MIRSLIYIITPFCLIFFISQTSFSAKKSGRAIFEDVRNQMKGFKYFVADSKLENFKGKKSEKTQEFKIKVLEGKDVDKVLITFEKPRDVKGTKILSYTDDGGEEFQYLFLPSLRRTKRITGTSKAGAFMGSEFSYDDVSRDSINDYTYKLLKSTGKHYQVEMIPKKKGNSYSKKIATVLKSKPVISKLKLYNKGKKHIKTISFSEFKKYKGKYWLPSLIKAVNKRSSRTSTMRRSKISFDGRYSERDFKKEALSR